MTWPPALARHGRRLSLDLCAAGSVGSGR